MQCFPPNSNKSKTMFYSRGDKKYYGNVIIEISDIIDLNLTKTKYFKAVTSAV